MRTILIALLLLSAVEGHANDGAVLRSQFVEWQTAARADTEATRMRASLESLEDSVRWLTAPGYLLSDGSWADIDYLSGPEGEWGPWNHSRRLFAMAKAYQTPGHGLHHDPLLRVQINSALAYTKKFYGATILPSGNWWFWTIGIPIDLGPTLLLMEGDVDQDTFDDLVFAIRFRIGRWPTSRGLVGPVPVGQNLVWSSYTHFCLALLENDDARLAAVRDAMANVVRPSAAEGIKIDRSFHQHGAQLYTGGYGGAFASDVARYALMTRGTEYELPPDALASFANYIADGIAWSLHGNYFDPSVVGREVVRPGNSGFNGLAALLQASRFPSPRREEIRRAAAQMLASRDGGLSPELAAIAVELESEGVTGSWPAGHRHYWSSDYTVHRRAGWFASIKMFSTRTKSGESTNGENLRGSRQSDGRFHLAFRGDEYFRDNVWPAFDWTRMPGTTVEQKADTANASYGYGSRTLAGGTGDGANGVSAMDLDPLNSLLTARKSWFFFDDAIVFLTNGIRCPNSNKIETIVAQWPLANPAAAYTRRDDWAVAEGVGYWFPSSQDVRISRETRSGTWAALGGSTDTTVHGRTFLTMLFDHGSWPSDATAEYVIVPGMSSSSMAQWVASRPLSIIANNDSASAVRDLRTGNLGIAFWKDATVEGFRSSAAAVVYVRLAGDIMRISAADPNGNASGYFELTVPGGWITTSVSSRRTLRSTMLTIPRAGGKTTEIVLERVKPRRRAGR